MADPIREKLKALGNQPTPDADQLRADVALMRERFPEAGERLGAVVELFLDLFTLFAYFTTTKVRLNRLFSFISERARNIFSKGKATTEDADAASGTADSATADAGTGEGSGAPTTVAPTKPPRHNTAGARKPRIGAKKRYPDAENIVHEHPDLKCGQRCPECDRGNLYDIEAIRRLRMLGLALVDMKLHVFKRLRCSGCQKIYAQTIPPEMQECSDEAFRAALGIYKYDAGLPFNRLEMLTGNFGVEVPKSTIFDMVEKVADAVAPVHEALVDAAADAEVIIADDTTARILDHAKTREEGERKGIFTTGIVARSEGGPTIHLYVTGAHHAGDNLMDLRERRDEELPDPIQMCDALNRNFPKGLRMLPAKCLVHGRRNFVDCHAAFPVECEFVIRQIGEVYKHDRECKERGFDKFQRLAWHVEHSGPIMDELLAYAHRNLDGHLVEPNGELGKALQYLINHWPGLTLFLKVPGCPLDTTEVERALKVPIRNRKNALFFKTQHGATIGDILMSVIRTAKASGVNPFDYLIELQKHKSRVFRNPVAWLPWNFRATLDRIAAGIEGFDVAEEEPVEAEIALPDVEEIAC